MFLATLNKQQHLNISTFGTIKLNSFRPLCSTLLGIEAIKKYKLPPFIDGSCRREPDFENQFPSITALCRKSKFAPHLRKDDIIVYMTVGGKFPPHKYGHHLVAILQVVEIYRTHQLGQNAYLKDGLLTPSNCMVTGNPPFDFDKTFGNFKKNPQLKTFLSRSQKQQLQIGRTLIKAWDSSYLATSLSWSCFVKTNSIYLNIDNPILILRSDLCNIFSKLPGTQTPKILTNKQFIELVKLIDLDITLEEKK